MFGRLVIILCCLPIAGLALAAQAPTRVMDLRVPPPDAGFDFGKVRPEPPRLFLVRRPHALAEAVQSRDDAMPVGRLRSFTSRFAPWRGSPWMAPERIENVAPFE